MVLGADRREPIVALLDERAAIQEIGDMLAARVRGRPEGPMLVGPDGVVTPLPEALYEVLAQAASELAAGHGIAILPYGARLTTQQAADMLFEELNQPSDELDQAVAAFLALALADLGREREALSISLGALSKCLPRYNRSLARYAEALNSAA